MEIGGIIPYMSDPKQKPFQGSEGIIKNLSTLPDTDDDRESLLNEVSDTTDSEVNHPAQDNQEGSNDSK